MTAGLSNKCSLDLYLSKESSLYNLSLLLLFQPLFSLTVMSSVPYEFLCKFFSPYVVLLQSKREGFPTYSETVADLPPQETKYHEGSGQQQLGFGSIQKGFIIKLMSFFVLSCK